MEFLPIVFNQSLSETLTKIRFYGNESLLDESQILLQADRGPRDPLPEDVRKSIYEGAIAEISDSSAIVLSDYDKGVLDTPDISTIDFCKATRSAGHC